MDKIQDRPAPDWRAMAQSNRVLLADISAGRVHARVNAEDIAGLIAEADRWEAWADRLGLTASEPVQLSAISASAPVAG